MAYKLEFHPKAYKELQKLDNSIAKFILSSLKEFIENFDEAYEAELLKSGKIKALKGEYSGFYRLRLRSYRVIYEKQERKLVILVLRIAHRKEVY
ncbi:MAG: type II toxin-antitoxin system RelE/ParE family toxin [Epsilonproteobacteria bacterium]|nr:type II toxin-antitoxin system RelE/ParE family toxin [Campylobacterota bacterium]NPA64491.1 type II toxin-antitoxin system RelE/ParE family toxin [Campylobacterota bacterium]